VTMTAGTAKIFSSDPKLGFIAHAHGVDAALAAGTLPAGIRTAAAARQIMFNDYLDAAVAGFFMLSVLVILADSLREWTAVLRGQKPALSTEVPFEPLAAAGD
jgi:carbon starvation protein